MARKFVNEVELRECLGISKVTVESYIDKGCPHTVKNNRRTFELNRVERWRQRFIKKLEPNTGYNDEKLSIAKLKRQKLEIELEERRGELVNREHVNRFLFTMSRQTRDAFLSLADRLAGPVSAEENQHTNHKLITDECRRILEDLAKIIENWKDDD